jgi:transcription initiation factor TFIID subunit 9B
MYCFMIQSLTFNSSRVRNAQPLPQPKPTSGLHLPPDRFCITACNYKLAKAAKKKPAAAGTGPYFSNPNTFGAPKMMVAPPGSTLIQPGFALVGKSPAMPPKSNVTIPMPKFQIQTGPGLSGQTPMFSMTINPPQMQGIGGIKRKSGEMDS